MTAQERKDKTQRLLKQLDIPFNCNLPVIEEENDAIIRDAADIARRIIIVTYLCLYGDDGNKNEITDFLKSEELWRFVSDDEKILFSKPELTEKDKINISWQSERIYIMLWTINKVNELGLPIDQCNVGEMLKLLPEFFQSTKEFISSSTSRTTLEILDASDLIYRLHWAARQADLEEKEIPGDISLGIVQEWHYAINWITFYDENWDEITTDT